MELMGIKGRAGEVGGAEGQDLLGECNLLWLTWFSNIQGLKPPTLLPTPETPEPLYNLKLKD